MDPSRLRLAVLPFRPRQRTRLSSHPNRNALVSLKYLSLAFHADYLSRHYTAHAHERARHRLAHAGFPRIRSAEL